VLGPRARAVLSPWLERDPDSFCFRPIEAVAERNARGRVSGSGPRSALEKAKAAKPLSSRPPGERYSKDSYRWAIRRACLKAGVATWAPNQLRHTRATQIRKKYGIEAAQVILGHAKADTTEIYAERDLEKARKVMDQIG
jgi:integrase